MISRRRLQHVLRAIGLQTSPLSSSSTSGSISIGDVRVVLPANLIRSDLVPCLYQSPFESSQEYLGHLRWLFQKDALSQDMFLLGMPGPLRRRLAFRWAELAHREIEYLQLTRDTAEPDLKQRRELKMGKMVFVDQAPVRSAIFGRVLILEGVEKAEQNVLPTLNNLLENREMALEDGRFLMHPVRFDSLLRTHTADELASKGLIRVHPNFRVIALGTPVPFFPGLPLDPPLRSRFQARNIQFPKIDSSVDGLIRTFPNVHVDLISKLVTFVESLRHLEQNHSVNQNTTSRYPHFTSDPSLLDLLRIVSLLPANIARSISEIPFDWFVSVYPFPILCGSVAQRESLSQIMIKFKLISDEKVHPPLLNKVSSAGADANELMASFSMAAAEFGIRIREAVPVSHGFLLSKNFVETSESRKILSSMLFSYTIGRSLALVGDKGVGKSVLARHFCNLIGYFPVEFIYLFKDMTTRELLQRRSTDSDGNTKWTLGPLARAAIEGRVCVLDGLDRLTSATASTLSQLLLDGELNLFDGTRLLRHDRYQALIHSGLSEATLLERGIKPVHPMFRCIALALAPTSKNQWLSAEIQTLFSWHLISSSSKPNQFVIVHNRFPDLPVSTLNLILDLSEALEKLSNSAISLSNRQLIRIAAHVQKFGQSELGLVLGRVLLLPLLPTTQRNIVNEVLSKFGISNNSSMQTPVPELIVNESHVKLGGIQLPRANPKEPALVPSIVFFNIPQHMLHLQDLMKDWICQEKYLLLIGTQGVGKNKLADRMMELLRLEREYMQLHRDTSIAQLTTMPSMENGKVIYVDSPLVRAAIHGRILLLDECDKAPLEVVCILKGLIEDGQLLLSDGRRLIDAERFQLDSRSQADDSIPIHPNFRCILLANKAGWPFLGNDLFREMGDVVSAHVIENPDVESELALLRSYAPSVDVKLLRQLVQTFCDLRNGVSSGIFSYPYSTREAVAIVKHMQQYPADGLLQALHNVLSFDAFDSNSRDNLLAIFHKNGIPFDWEVRTPGKISLAPAHPLPAPRFAGTWDISSASLQKFPSTVSSLVSKSVSLSTSVENKNTHFQNARVENFSEHVASFKLPLPETSQVLASCAMQDGTIVLLASDPMCLYIVPSSTGFRHFYSVDLDDFLPFSHMTSSRSDATSESASFHFVSPQLRSQYSILAGRSPTEIFVFSESQGIVHALDLSFLQRSDWNATHKPSVPLNMISVPIGPNSSNAKSILSMLSPGFRIASRFRGSAGSSAATLQIVSDTHHLGDSQRPKTFCFFSGSSVAFLVADKIYHSTLPFSCSCVAKFSSDSWLVTATDGNFWIIFNDTQHASISAYQVSGAGISAAKSMISFNDVASVCGTVPTELCSEARGALISFATHGGGNLNGSLSASFHVIDSDPKRMVQGAFAAHVNLSKLVVPSVADQVHLSVVDKELGHVRHINVPASKFNVANTASMEDLLRVHSSRQAMTTDARDEFQNARLNVIHPPLQSHPSILNLLVIPHTQQQVVALVRTDGQIQLFDVDARSTSESLSLWKSLFGDLEQSSKPLRLEIESKNQKDASKPKVGEFDGKQHVGGNRYKGGSGGADTAGLGGKGGPYRFDGGHDVHQLSDAEKNRISDEAKRAAREMGQAELKKRLQEIDITSQESQIYNSYLQKVRNEITQTRNILENADVKKREREWLKNQQHGELDENRIVDGATGERLIFKRRGNSTPLQGLPPALPKRMCFVVDISGSMYRFNGADQRLDRMLEVVTLIMESLHGFDHKFQWSLVGHSGDGPSIPLISYGKAPKTAADRLKVLLTMQAHAQYCMSGDYTVEATRQAIASIVQEPADDHFVIVFSDANFRRYGIDPARFGTLLTSDSRVNTMAIFIASFGDEAKALCNRFPNNAVACFDAQTLPSTFQHIFTQSDIVSKD